MPTRKEIPGASAQTRIPSLSSPIRGRTRSTRLTQYYWLHLDVLFRVASHAIRYQITVATMANHLMYAPSTPPADDIQAQIFII